MSPYTLATPAERGRRMLEAQLAAFSQTAAATMPAVLDNPDRAALVTVHAIADMLELAAELRLDPLELTTRARAVLAARHPDRYPDPYTDPDY